MFGSDHAAERAGICGSGRTVNTSGSVNQCSLRNEDNVQRAALLSHHKEAQKHHEHSAKVGLACTRAPVRLPAKKSSALARARAGSDCRDATLIATCARTTRAVRDD